MVCNSVKAYVTLSIPGNAQEVLEFFGTRWKGRAGKRLRQVYVWIRPPHYHVLIGVASLSASHKHSRAAVQRSLRRSQRLLIKALASIVNEIEPIPIVARQIGIFPKMLGEHMGYPDDHGSHAVVSSIPWVVAMPLEDNSILPDLAERVSQIPWAFWQDVSRTENFTRIVLARWRARRGRWTYKAAIDPREAWMALPHDAVDINFVASEIRLTFYADSPLRDYCFKEEGLEKDAIYDLGTGL